LNILSIQSHVSYGHVGNSAAVFALQRLGCEVWPVHTVTFSNHPGHGGFGGRVVDAGEVASVIDGIARLGALAQCDAVLSGYLGSPETGPVVLDAVLRARKANKAMVYCCDPVLGDADSGLYVRDGLPQFMRERALQAADILTPNHFELEYLSEAKVSTRNELVSALRKLHGIGPKTILVTSVITSETPSEAVDIVASDGRFVHLVRTPRLGRTFNGAGDLLAALFLLHRLRGRSAAEALEVSVASVFGVLRRTLEKGARELVLVEAQHELVAPSGSFPVEIIASIA